MQVDLVVKPLHDCYSTNECIGIELGNWGSLGYNISIPKICSKIDKAIEDLLKKDVGIPMKQLHSAKTLLPMYPIRMIDDGNKIEKDLTRNWLRLVAGADLLEQIAMMIVFMLMHRLEKLTKKVIVPMQDIAVFPFVLWESVKSMTFSKVAFTSVLLSHSTRQAFFWRRKADGSIESTSFMRLMTFFVAKFP
jgi:hypothetical protein